MSRILNMHSRRKAQEENKQSDVERLQDMLEAERMKNRERKPTVVIELSWRLVFVFLFVLATIFLSQQILTMFLFLFIALVVMSSVRPIVKWLLTKGISMPWAVTMTYLLILVLVSAVVAIVIVPVINQFDNLVESIPIWVTSAVAYLEGFTIGEYTFDTGIINRFLLDFFDRLTQVDIFGDIAGRIGSAFKWTTIFLASIIFSIYLVIDHDNILEAGLVKISSDQKRKRVKKLIVDVEYKLGRWLLGQAAVSSIGGITLGIVLTLFNIPFALPMAVFIAVMTAIPTLGAIISAIPPLFVALVLFGPWTALILLVIFVIYQEVENVFISPKIMGDAMGIKPIFVMFTAASLFILLGVWGAVLAVPALVLLNIGYEFYVDLQKLKAKGRI
jgi:putative heme transporter